MQNEQEQIRAGGRGSKTFWMIPKCFQKCFESFFLCFFLFLLMISDKVARRCLCRQDLRTCVLQITQNNISHPKSLMVNYIIIQINFLSFLCWFKHAFIWKVQRTEFSSNVCKFVFCNLCKIIQVTLNDWLLII